ncbi:MAG TPA: DUF2145 domain-containing protein [Solimonas sp.]|nr:DUF2145 domain-containing protein [Solimonas sp.]
MRALPLLALLLCLGLLPIAHAGQTCEDKPLTPQAMHQALRLTQDLQATLDRQQARAAILGRVGSDVSRYGLRYTHAGIAYRSGLDQPWTVLHKLNNCGTDHAALYRQGLLNFFLDDPHEYRALALLPKPALQERIVRAAEADAGSSVDQPRYSLLAYPYTLDYQNSNGWALEFLAVASADVPLLGRAAAQDYLRRSGYRADRIEISAAERVGATLFKANVAFLDHPLGERLGGRYSVVTVESIARYLGERQLITDTQELIANR